MTRQLFIYYRIPKADIALGLRCAKHMAACLKEKGLGHSQLFQREEAGKPYFTLMEVIYPAPEYLACEAAFIETLAQLANASFADFPVVPSRHVEVFSEVDNEVGNEVGNEVKQ